MTDPCGVVGSDTTEDTLDGSTSLIVNMEDPRG